MLILSPISPSLQVCKREVDRRRGLGEELRGGEEEEEEEEEEE